jgi:hypothetical protein
MSMGLDKELNMKAAPMSRFTWGRGSILVAVMIARRMTAQWSSHHCEGLG